MAYLDNVAVFVRVVELGNLSAAGRDMRISPAVASNRIKELEKHLGVRLFNRTTRQLMPTEQGRVFYDGAKKVLEAVADAEAAVSALSGQPRGTIRVTAPLGLGRRMIASGIPEFRNRYPDIEVRLRLSDHEVDIMKEGIDVAFRLGLLEDSSLRMRGILDCERVLVASPSYLERRGEPQPPEDLLRLRRRRRADRLGARRPRRRSQASLRGRALHPRPAAEGDPGRYPARDGPARRSLPAPPVPGHQAAPAARLHGRPLPTHDPRHPGWAMRPGTSAMARPLALAFAWGVAGMVGLPLAIYLLVQALARAFDPACGAGAGAAVAATCAGGAFGLALAAVMPAFALFFLIGLAMALRRRRLQADFASVLDRGTAPPDEEDRRARDGGS